MRSKCVISISHSNYLYKGAGTEKCMRETRNILISKDIHYLQIFSFEKYSNLYKFSDMSNKVGVNYDDTFLGIYTYSSLLSLLNNVSIENKTEFIGIHINNVINHDLCLLKEFIQSIKLPVIVWLHDYSSICDVSPILLDGNGVCCNNFSKNLSICTKCSKYLNSFEENDVFDFYNQINDSIKHIIAPSESVKRNTLVRYTFWNNKISVRPHLKFSDKVKRKDVSYPIKIAFVGGKYSHKGYREWQELTNVFKDNKNYQFYYLGSSISDTVDYIKDIRVDVATQGENAMKNAIRNNNIDIAFLWSKCQETYSYTYYESFCSGARIITNEKSGNIAEQTIKNKSGLVLENVNELIELMSNFDEFKKKINSLDGCYFANYETNDSIENLVLNGSLYGTAPMKKVKSYKFLMLLYITKNNLIRKKGNNAKK